MNKDESIKNYRRVLVIDSQIAGVSGDMFLGALVDLGASTARITKAYNTAINYLRDCSDLRIEASAVNRCGIRAQKVDILFQDKASARSGTEIKEVIERSTKEIGLSECACRFAKSSVETLICAEKKVHGKVQQHDIHFHEIGSADTVADILGSAVALDELGVFVDTLVYTTPIAVGEGSIKISHGIVPVPAPATLEILRAKNLPLIGGSLTSELATPTGVSIVGNLAHEIAYGYPPMKPIAIGYGAGNNEFTEMANVVRITLGEPLSQPFQTDGIYVLETNLDDISGEVIGHTMDILINKGARDCCIIPTYSKKNRPGQILQVITDKNDIERMARIVIEETGTLGVRFFPCDRFILKRETLSINLVIKGKQEKVRVKVSRDNSGHVMQVKPEYEDARRIAESSGCPLRETLGLIQLGAWNEIGRENR